MHPRMDPLCLVFVVLGVSPVVVDRNAMRRIIVLPNTQILGISSTPSCIMVGGEERGAGAGTSQTQQTPQQLVRAHAHAHTHAHAHSQDALGFSCTHTVSGFQSSFVDSSRMLMVQLRKTPKMSQTHSQRGRKVSIAAHHCPARPCGFARATGTDRENPPNVADALTKRHFDRRKVFIAAHHCPARPCGFNEWFDVI